jgi:hypothetical protein
VTNAARALCAAGLASAVILLADAATGGRIAGAVDRIRHRRRRQLALVSDRDPKLAAAIEQVARGRWGD